MDYTTSAAAVSAIAAAVVTIWKALTKVGAFLALKLFDEQQGLVTRTVAKHLQTMDKAQETMDTVARAVELQHERDQRRELADARRDKLLEELTQRIDSRPCIYRHA